jgi:hypothetical protein
MKYNPNIHKTFIIQSVDTAQIDVLTDDCYTVVLIDTLIHRCMQHDNRWLSD